MVPIANYVRTAVEHMLPINQRKQQPDILAVKIAHRAQ